MSDPAPAPSARVLQPGQGEVLRLRPPGRSGEVTVKVDPAGAGSAAFSMGTQRLEPGARIPTHLHDAQEEILFVHAGHGVILVEDARVPAEPGTTAYIPRGVWHGVENPGPKPLHLVWLISPPGLEEMFRAIGAPPDAPVEPLSAEEFAILAGRHGVTVQP